MFGYFFKSLRLILSIVFIFLGVLFFILYTQPGLNFSLVVADKLLPGDLSFENAKGHLLGNFSINNIHYQDQGIDIRIKNLSLIWTPKELLHYSAVIQSLILNDINVNGTLIKNINLSGNTTLNTPFNFSSDILWVSKSISGHALLAGNQNEYQGKISAMLTVSKEKIYPINADIHATLEKLKATIIAGEPSQPVGQLMLEGQHSPNLNLDWTLLIPQLSKFTADPKSLSGNINIKGKIQGTPDDTNITTAVEGQQLKYQTVYLKKLLSHLNIQHIQTPKIFATWDLQLSPGDLIYDDGTKKNVIPFNKFLAQATWDNHLLKTNIVWIFDAAKRFEGEFKVQPLNRQTFDINYLERQHLSGKLLFAMNNLDFMNNPDSPLKKIQGAFHAEFNVAGTLAKPTWNGKANLKARGLLPDLGITLDPIELNLESDPKHMILNGKIASGKNALLIKGESDIPEFKTLNINITGNNFLITNTGEYKIYLSPDLKIQREETKNTEFGKITITGNIDVPSAKIQPIEFTQAVELPPDVVFVSKEKPKNTAPLFELESRINVHLGNDIRIKTHGVNGRLEGSVLVIDKNNQPTAGEGEIRIIDGVYDAYGQKLDISEGKASFAGGPIDNPQLSIKATRVFNISNNVSPITNTNIPSGATATSSTIAMTDFNKVTVGVEITGYAANPTVRLFSVPATLSQADILSFLVLGRPMSQASSADGALLMRALSATNIDGGASSQITQDIQKTFGLDLFNIESSSDYNSDQTTTGNSTALVFGKRFSTKLFVDYSIGLMQGTNILKIKYVFTPNWMLQTATDGTNQGVDVVYSITKD